VTERKGDIRGEDWLGAADRLFHVAHHRDFVEREHRERACGTQACKCQRRRGYRLHLREDVRKPDALEGAPEHIARERGEQHAHQHTGIGLEAIAAGIGHQGSRGSTAGAEPVAL